MTLQPPDTDTLRQVLALPTAPFHEAHVARFVEAFARERDLPCRQDRFGNLYVTYRHGRPRSGPLVLEAHMDHPGFHINAVHGSIAELAFLGKTAATTLDGQSLRVYSDAEGDSGGGAAKVVRSKPGPGFYRPLMLEAEVPAGVRAGDFAVFDLPTWQLDGTRLSARAHDDLAQVAAVLCTLDRLARGGDEAHVVGLFTRAEEVGFIGAYGATEADLLPRDAVIVSLECSGLPRERGFVVRCGDKTTVFDGWATTRLLELADAEAAQDEHFIFQTPIPRRGTCNASLYTARGWVATGLTLPMENYHNWGDGAIRPEIIDTRDWATLVNFLGIVCTQFGPYEDTRRRVQQHVERLWHNERQHLQPDA